MGTEYIVIHPTSEYSGELKTVMEEGVKDNIRYLGERCREKNITLAMENYPTGVGQFPATLDAYVREWNMPNMRPMVDTTEVIEGGGEPIAFIEQLAAPPCHLHLSDFSEGKKHQPIGTGEIDWPRLFKLLKERNYAGYYTLEPSYRHYLSDIPAKLQRDYATLSRLVESV
jgi:sugar phosphate isomerase/epimerase